MYEIIWCVIFPHEVKKDLFYNGINRVAGGRKFMFMVLCLYIFERKNKEKENLQSCLVVFSYFQACFLLLIGTETLNFSVGISYSYSTLLAI